MTVSIRMTSDTAGLQAGIKSVQDQYQKLQRQIQAMNREARDFEHIDLRGIGCTAPARLPLPSNGTIWTRCCAARPGKAAGEVEVAEVEAGAMTMIATAPVFLEPDSR